MIKTNVYIATLPRSGSTLLGMILNNHPKIFHIGESSYWGKLLPCDVKCSCGLVNCKFLNEIYGLIGHRKEIKSIYEFCCYIDKLEEPNKIYHQLSLPNQDAKIQTPKNTDHLLYLSHKGLELIADAFRLISTRKIIVDNTKNIRIAQRLVKFKHWKIILLTRHPCGVVNSSKNAGKRKKVYRSIKMKIPVLINFAQRTSSLLNLSNVLYVKYEDLCENPKRELSRICSFLNVYFMPSMIDFKNDKGHILMGNRMRLDDKNNRILFDEKWKTELTQEELSLVIDNQELQNMYSHFGYSLKEGANGKITKSISI